VNLAASKPNTEVNGKVVKYHIGTTLMEAKISKVNQQVIIKVKMLKAFLDSGSAMLCANITPSQVAIKETI